MKQIISDLKAKTFSWNFELDNNLLQFFLKTHCNWMSQEIALIFIKKSTSTFKHITN